MTYASLLIDGRFFRRYDSPAKAKRALKQEEQRYADAGLAPALTIKVEKAPPIITQNPITGKLLADGEPVGELIQGLFNQCTDRLDSFRMCDRDRFVTLMQEHGKKSRSTPHHIIRIMKTHSPAPWTVKAIPIHVSITHAIQNGNSDVANVLHNGHEDANAALIAAAPELLEWLKKAVQMSEQQYTGGDNTPLTTSWAWLHDQMAAVIERATAV